MNDEGYFEYFKNAVPFTLKSKYNVNQQFTDHLWIGRDEAQNQGINQKQCARLVVESNDNDVEVKEIRRNESEGQFYYNVSFAITQPATGIFSIFFRNVGEKSGYGYPIQTANSNSWPSTTNNYGLPSQVAVSSPYLYLNASTALTCNYIGECVRSKYEFRVSSGSLESGKIFNYQMSIKFGGMVTKDCEEGNLPCSIEAAPSFQTMTVVLNASKKSRDLAYSTSYRVDFGNNEPITEINVNLHISVGPTDADILLERL